VERETGWVEDDAILKPLSFSKAGDEAVAVRMEATSKDAFGFAFVIDLMQWRKADVVAALAHMALGNENSNLTGLLARR
jgi:hypothetical protein